MRNPDLKNKVKGPHRNDGGWEAKLWHLGMHQNTQRVLSKV